MHRPISKKQLIARNIIVFFIMPVSVIFLVTMLTLMTLGYTVDFNKKSITQGGLLQAGTTPSGATVDVDGTALSRKTPMRYDLEAGKHEISMKLDGYRTWKKNISLQSGQVLWLNYARLYPVDLDKKSVRNYPEVTSSAVSSGGNRIALTQKSNVPTITIEDISGDTVETTTVVLPLDTYSVAENTTAQEFTVVEWAALGDARILLRHEYDGKKEWLLVDVNAPEKTRKLQSYIEGNMQDVRLDRKNPEIAHALVDGALYTIDVAKKKEDGVTKRVIVGEVKRFSIQQDDSITYSAYEKDKKKEYVGVVSSEKYRQVAYRDKTSIEALATGVYDGRAYRLEASAQQMRILPVTSSDATSSEKIKPIAEFDVQLSPTASYSFSPSGRFVAIQHITKLYTYDIELKQWHTISLPENEGYKAEWLDDVSLRLPANGKLVVFEFDGTNQHNLGYISSEKVVTLSRNGKYLYSFLSSKDGSGASYLQRLQMYR